MNPPPPKPSTAMTDEQETSTGQPTRVPAGAPIARMPAGEGTAKTGRRVTVESLSAYYGGQQAVKLIASAGIVQEPVRAESRAAAVELERPFHGADPV